MEYIFNEIQMRNYISYRLDRKVTRKEFKDCKDNLISWVDYIKNDYESDGKEIPHEEGCSTEIKVDNEEGSLEVWVKFIYEDGKVFIDFDYSYDKFVESVWNEIFKLDDD